MKEDCSGDPWCSDYVEGLIKQNKVSESSGQKKKDRIAKAIYDWKQSLANKRTK